MEELYDSRIAFFILLLSIGFLILCLLIKIGVIEG